ncbi:MAG: biotin--[acetyl-CoA-carboxylase] ligase [Pirellulales bacterium]|nr:biotin--[acetyl-CoA-carboxylase] ligase [Pirellulales bacterium]
MEWHPIDTRRLLAETLVARAEEHGCLASTNDRAKEALADGGPLPLLVVARRQTAGRGRGSNRWWTGPGSLAFSLALGPDRLPDDRRQTGLVSLAAAVAVVRAVQPRVEDRTLGIHWPNDVYLEGRKLCGVLIEAPSTGGLIVGVGLNTNNTLDDAPEELRPTAVTLLDITGSTWDSTDALVAVLREFETLLHQIIDQPEEVASAADRLCLQTGRTLTVTSGVNRQTGRCLGIAPDGALLLDTPTDRRAVHGGIVTTESSTHP